ncbi:MAG: FAD-binding oxidoreductase [Candidatus Latescibacteria bacterium]|nr:FAD-binding oxidoreductase [Candidatus Latescibacterota bacterium]
MVKTADIVIIGGGCMGASLAFSLARRGVKHVVLLERKRLASGPTGKSLAILRQHYGVESMVFTSQRSLEIFSHFDDAVGGDTGFVRTGYVKWVAAHDRAALEANVAMQRRIGANVLLLDAADLAGICPGVQVDDVAAAAYHPDSGYADPIATTLAFARRARDFGATIVEGVTVTGLRLSAGRIAAVETSEGVIATPVVVNSAGAWGARVARMVGVELPIQTIRPQICLFKRPPALDGMHPIYSDSVTGMFYRPEQARLSFVGIDVSEGEIAKPADPDAYDESVDSGLIARLRPPMEARLPAMRWGVSRGGYAAIYDMTPDEQPIIGHIPEVEGFSCNLGWSGHGFKHCPAIGLLMAELITEGRTTGFDITAFRASRFKEGQPITERKYQGGSKEWMR